MAKSKKQPAKRQPRTQARKQPEPTLVQKILANKVRLVVLLLLIAVPVTLFVNQDNSNNGSNHQAQAQEQQQEDQENQKEQPAEDQEKDNQASETAENNEAEATGDYSYVAQPGDTYSQIARKAIQTYGVNNNVNLSPAQIIYAETLLTQEAGSPLLSAGQKISVKEATVKSWVEKAQKLSDNQEKAWAAYTVGVNFNTDQVGEA